MARPKNFRVKTKKYKYHKTTHRKQHINVHEKTKREIEHNVRYSATRATRKARTHYNNLKANGLTKFSYSARYQNRNDNIAFRKIRNNTNYEKVKQSLISAREFNNKRTSKVNGVVGSVKGSLNAIFKSTGKEFTNSEVKDIINKGGTHTTNFWTAVDKVRDMLASSGNEKYSSDDIIKAVTTAVDDIQEPTEINEGILKPNDGSKGMEVKVYSTNLSNITSITKENAETIADYAFDKLTGAIDKFDGEMVPRYE